jgi:hypothetical protein
MFCWITFLGGVLIMMGQHSRLEALWFTGLRPDQEIRTTPCFPRIATVEGQSYQAVSPSDYPGIIEM